MVEKKATTKAAAKKTATKKEFLYGRVEVREMLLASQPGSLALLVIFAVAFKKIICHEFIP